MHNLKQNLLKMKTKEKTRKEPKPIAEENTPAPPKRTDAGSYTFRITNDTDKVLNGIDLNKPTNPANSNTIKVMEIATETNSGHGQFLYGVMAQRKGVACIKISLFKDGVPHNFEDETIEVKCFAEADHNPVKYSDNISHFLDAKQVVFNIATIGKEVLVEAPLFILDKNTSIKFSGLNPGCSLLVLVYICNLLPDDNVETIGINMPLPKKRAVKLKHVDQSPLFLSHGYTKQGGENMLQKKFIIDKDGKVKIDGGDSHEDKGYVSIYAQWPDGIFEKEQYFIHSKPESEPIYNMWFEINDQQQRRSSYEHWVGLSLTITPDLCVFIKSQKYLVPDTILEETIEYIEKYAIDLAKYIFELNTKNAIDWKAWQQKQLRM